MCKSHFIHIPCTNNLPSQDLTVQKLNKDYILWMQSKDDTSCFDDYSKLGPMKHEFVLSADDQLLFKDL